MKKKRIFKGWFNPKRELPQKTLERTSIIFGNTKWYPTDKRCTITVEWKE